jgi:predicted component of type VI protein secretion system
MAVKLRILHGKLQDKKGHQASLEVEIKGPRFVIGSGPDCQMCCKSSTVSTHHCEVRIEERKPVVHDLRNETGTFVNGQRVEGQSVLETGDILRVGRLEFEVLIEASDTSKHEAPAPYGEELEDEVGEEISDLLAEADERDRLRRLQDPELRHLHLESAPPKPQPSEEAPSEDEQTAEDTDKKGKKKRPRGLPKRPPETEHVPEDSTEAAQEALRKLFSPR